MAELINLRLARKARARAEKQDQAAANRARFGQTKSQRKRIAHEAERAARELAGIKRDGDG